MKGKQMSVLWGIVLVVVGMLVLLQNLGYLETLMPLAWVGLFGLAGLVFLYVFLTNRDQWWAVIPGMVLAGIALLIALDEVAPRLGGDLGGTVFLGMISLAFWIVYLTRKEFWWAIIPGGVLGTLAGVAALDAVDGGDSTAGVFFMGMGLTFLLVALMRGGSGRRWALIPAAVMMIMGLSFGANSAGLLGYLWPVVLIGIGGYFVFRSLMAQPQGE